MLMMTIGNNVITIMNHLVNVSLHIWPSSDDDDGVDDIDDYEDDGEDEGDSDDHVENEEPLVNANLVLIS